MLHRKEKCQAKQETSYILLFCQILMLLLPVKGKLVDRKRYLPLLLLPGQVHRSETDDEALASDKCSEEDYDYVCYECLGSFQQDITEKNGTEWVKCGCGQWIHEDCIDQVVTGRDGKDTMCSNCVL